MSRIIRRKQLKPRKPLSDAELMRRAQVSAEREKAAQERRRATLRADTTNKRLEP